MAPMPGIGRRRHDSGLVAIGARGAGAPHSPGPSSAFVKIARKAAKDYMPGSAISRQLRARGVSIRR